jgi:prepilin-type N-terminal cleavage/methylation domain-containing protein
MHVGWSAERQTRSKVTTMNAQLRKRRTGFSLLELLAVVTIVGIIAAIVVPRVSVATDTSKSTVDRHCRATINGAIERWFLEKGTWPAADLSDIATDLNYFPSGLPVSPVDGSTYTMNTSSRRLN